MKKMTSQPKMICQLMMTSQLKKLLMLPEMILQMNNKLLLMKLNLL
jgi:hypothetical protein